MVREYRDVRDIREFRDIRDVRDVRDIPHHRKFRDVRDIRSRSRSPLPRSPSRLDRVGGDGGRGGGDIRGESGVIVRRRKRLRVRPASSEACLTRGPRGNSEEPPSWRHRDNSGERPRRIRDGLDETPWRGPGDGASGRSGNIRGRSRASSGEPAWKPSTRGVSEGRDGGGDGFGRDDVPRRRHRDRASTGGRGEQSGERRQLVSRPRSASPRPPTLAAAGVSPSVSRVEGPPASRRRRRRNGSPHPPLEVRREPSGCPQGRSSSPRRQRQGGTRQRHRSKESGGEGGSDGARGGAKPDSRSAGTRQPNQSQSPHRRCSRSRSCRCRCRSRSRDDQRRLSERQSPQRQARKDPRGPKPEGCRTIWVGWLDKRPAEADIVEFFKECGTVTEVRCSDRHVRGYFAHVQFEDTNGVDEAMKKAGEFFDGHRVQLDYAYMDKVTTNPSRDAEAPSSRRYRPKSVKPPNGRTMWIGDVSIDAAEQDLIDLFEPCGKIEMICLQVNQLRNGQFGHVKFFETEAVDKAAELGGTPVKGIPIRVDFAEDKPFAAYRVGKDRWVPELNKPDDCRTIWVGGLPNSAEVTEESIRQLFERCGEIKEVRLDSSKRGGASFCHVEYIESSSVDRAVRMSGERIMNSKIRVDFAENRKSDFSSVAPKGVPALPGTDHFLMGWRPSSPFLGPPPGWRAGALLPPGWPPPPASEGCFPTGWRPFGPRVLAPRPASVCVDPGSSADVTSVSPFGLPGSGASDLPPGNFFVPPGPPRPPRQPDGHGCSGAGCATNPLGGGVGDAEGAVAGDGMPSLTFIDESSQRPAGVAEGPKMGKDGDAPTLPSGEGDSNTSPNASIRPVPEGGPPLGFDGPGPPSFCPPPCMPPVDGHVHGFACPRVGPPLEQGGGPPMRPTLEPFRTPDPSYFADYYGRCAQAQMPVGRNGPPGPPHGYFGGPPPGYYGGSSPAQGYAGPSSPGLSGCSPDGYYGPPPHYHRSGYEYWRPPGHPGTPQTDTALASNVAADQSQGGSPKPSQAPAPVPPAEAAVVRSRSAGSGSYYSYSSYSYSPSRSPSRG
eukprot:TRINITY_DN14281_c0_g2_i1.p1 TRINITY_DN14281_c0_g2~~TRINITY_DN14281_c0_g2_i1.p1  ORF type:complete len:1077 (+),score=98.18 TRINITY_DN14281_c0_g2_i1:61-3231(+)